MVRNLPEIRVSPLGCTQPGVLQLLIAPERGKPERSEYRWVSHIVRHEDSSIEMAPTLPLSLSTWRGLFLGILAGEAFVEAGGTARPAPSGDKMQNGTMQYGASGNKMHDGGGGK